MKVLLPWQRNPVNHGVSESPLLECAPDEGDLEFITFTPAQNTSANYECNSYFKETVEYGSPGNPVTYHMGLLPHPGDAVPGAFEFTVSNVLCSKSRSCKQGADSCVEGIDGIFVCQMEEGTAWNFYQEMYLLPVAGTECTGCYE